MNDPRSVYVSRATASKGRTPWLVRPWLVRVALIAVTLVAANQLAGEEPTVIAALALGGSVALFGASWTHAVLAVRRDAVGPRGEPAVRSWPFGLDLLETGVYFAVLSWRLEVALAAVLLGKAIAWRGHGTGEGETEAAARARALEPFIGSLVNLAAAIVGAAIVLGLYSR